MLAVWAYQIWGTIDVRTVLDPRNVEHWVMSVNADQSVGWRENTRGALRTVGRAVNPQGWAVPSPPIGRTAIAVPYNSLDETGFVQAARLAGRFNRAARLWVVGGAFGGGLYGGEITAATVHDFEEIVDGRLVVATRGPKARMVPIRRAYTELVREALEHSQNGRFIQTTDRTLFTGSAADSTSATVRVCRCGVHVLLGCMPTCWRGRLCRRCDGSLGRCPPTPWTYC